MNSLVLQNQEMPFTGERFTAGAKLMHSRIYFEHLHRYLFAAELVKGLDTLDIASGEGYGAELLAKHARSVVGMDSDADTVAYARNKYNRGNLNFVVGTCEKIPSADCSFDVVISFETIEHIAEQEKFLSEVGRVLRPGGLLILSSPDRRNYNEGRLQKNPFHLRELSENELLQLLRPQFAHIVLLRQRLIAGSCIVGNHNPQSDRHERWGVFRGSLADGTFIEGLDDGVYSIVVCSARDVPMLNTGVFEDKKVTAEMWDLYDSHLRAQGSRSPQEELLSTRVSELEAEVFRRGEWGQSLDMELRKLQATVQEDALRYKSRERELVVKIQSCEGEIEQLRAMRTELEASLNSQRASAEQALQDSGVALSEAQNRASISEHKLAASERNRFDMEVRVREHEAEKTGLQCLLQDSIARRGTLELTISKLESQFRAALGNVGELERKLLEESARAEREVIAALHFRGESERKQVQLNELIQRLAASDRESELTISKLESQIRAAVSNLGQAERKLLEESARAEREQSAALHFRGESERKQVQLNELIQRLAASEMAHEKLTIQFTVNIEEQKRMLIEANRKMDIEVSRREEQLAAAQSLLRGALDELTAAKTWAASTDSMLRRAREHAEEFAATQRELNGIINSWSWRITGPLRRIHQMLGDPLYRHKK